MPTTLAVGDTLKARMGRIDDSLWADIQLYDPRGHLVAEDWSSLEAVEVTSTVTNSGVYTVICKGYGASTGRCGISVVRMPGYPLSSGDPQAGPIGNGGVLQGSIDQPGDLDAAQIAITAGDTLKARMGRMDDSLWTHIQLSDPRGRLVAEDWSSLDVVEVTSTVTNNGIYTVICKGHGASTGRYAVSTSLMGGHTLDDIDGDGVPNKDELSAWTDPFSAASVFRITNVVLLPATNRPAFSWQTVGSMRYRVQYSDNLSPAIFTDIVRSQAQETESDVPEGLPHWQDFTDTFAPPQGSPTNGVRFYRVRIVR